MGDLRAVSPFSVLKGRIITIFKIQFMSMRYFILTVLVLFCRQGMNAQTYSSASALLAAMHERYYQGPCACYSFSQRNTHYKADTVSGHSEWHEQIRFPDFFRIQFGEEAKGNYIIYKKDSLYHYEGAQLKKSKSDSISLLLILGGMYYRPLEEVLKRLKADRFDIEKMVESEWDGEMVWIIGAATKEEQSNQIWISKKDFRILRILQKRKVGPMSELRFEAHQKWCNGFVETKVSFWRDGKVEQREEYFNLKECE